MHKHLKLVYPIFCWPAERHKPQVIRLNEIMKIQRKEANTTIKSKRLAAE